MPINKFTTLLDLARQAKILTGETATFDGKIQVGIPFSGYPTGVDTGSTVSLGVVSSQSAVFSGNTGTTVFDTSNPLSPYYDPSFDSFSAFTWTNPLFSAYTSGLTLPITSLSADTQIVGPFWTLTETGYTGDYIIGTQYTGYTITYSFFNLTSLNTGSTLFSGFTNASQENFSADTLDYKGPLDYISSKEDATIDGRLITNKITITNGASASTIGYVLTQTGENGEGEWLPNSGGVDTYWTSGSSGNYSIKSITDTTTDATADYAVVTGRDNIASGIGSFIGGGYLSSATTVNAAVIGGDECIASGFDAFVGGGDNNKATSDDSAVIAGVFNTVSGQSSVIIGGSGGFLSGQRSAIIGGSNIIGSTNDMVYMPSATISDNLGIGTEPQYKFHIVSGNTQLYFDPTSLGGRFLLSGTTGLPRIDIVTPPSIILTKPSTGGSIGVRTWDDVTWTGYGKVGDMFVRSGDELNGLNLINGPGTNTEDYIRFYAGKNANSTPDIHIQGSGSTIGYVGIGTATPTAKLHVNNTSSSNSFLVEDSVNPDSTPFVINNNGDTGIGVLTPTEKLEVGGNGRFKGKIDVDNHYEIGGNKVLYINPSATTNNLFIGQNVGNISMTGDSNVAVGGSSFISNVSGNYNVAIGNNSLFYNIDGNNNVAIGQGALQNGTGGTYNIGIGISAGSGLSNQNNNIILGNWGGSPSAGNYNVMIGSTGPTGILSENIFIGTNANGANFTGGTGNVILGGRAFARSSGTYNFSIALGHYSEINASNQLVIGNRAGGAYITEAVLGYGIDVPDNATGDFNMRVTNVASGILDTTAVGSFRISGGKGTGTGTGSPIIFQTSPSGTSSSNQNAYVESARFTGEGVFRLKQFTATQASALAPSDADIIYVNSTNGTFTSVGFWGYENGSWVKL